MLTWERWCAAQAAARVEIQCELHFTDDDLEIACR
jgi:hypothetical protein